MIETITVGDFTMCPVSAVRQLEAKLKTAIMLLKDANVYIDCHDSEEAYSLFKAINDLVEEQSWQTHVIDVTEKGKRSK